VRSYQAVRVGLRELGNFDDLVASGTSTPYAKAALLYSETADIWLGAAGTPGTAPGLSLGHRHSMY
jgi:hypothetical protein